MELVTKLFANNAALFGESEKLQRDVIILIVCVKEKLKGEC